MFLSDAPWAIALILILLAPKLLNNFPLIPWWSFIRSPTTAIFVILDSKTAGATLFKEISKAKCSLITFFAISASSERTPKQIECSDDAWVIMIILICFNDKHSNKRFENPGIPIIPLPSRLISATFSMWLTPLTIDPLCSLLVPFELIIVPDALESKVFFMSKGIFFSIIGWRVGGNITFAPKCESSMASW